MCLWEAVTYSLPILLQLSFVLGVWDCSSVISCWSESGFTKFWKKQETEVATLTISIWQLEACQQQVFLEVLLSTKVSSFLVHFPYSEEYLTWQICTALLRSSLHSDLVQLFLILSVLLGRVFFFGFFFFFISTCWVKFCICEIIRKSNPSLRGHVRDRQKSRMYFHTFLTGISAT